MGPKTKVTVVKTFYAGRKSLSVRLLSTGVVEKRYDPRKSRHPGRFHQEVETLRRLKGCPFVPTLVSVDEDRLMFKMSYCGQALPKSKESTAIIDKLLHVLERDYGLMRHNNVGKTVYRLGTQNNATVLNGQVYIIDFGSSAFFFKDPKAKSKSSRANPARP
jgi:predicted Ser/Thr protein kinase